MNLRKVPDISNIKVILSRKGFDSEYGKIPSPIFPDGTMFSFPIPDEKGPHSYADLFCKQAGKNVADLLEDLTGKSYKDKKCHLDPDLNKDIIDRSSGWKGLFGQSGAEQGHLENQKVGKGDIFLFFGRFRPVEQINGKWQFVKNSAAKHIIFGYLQVKQMIKLYKGEKSLPWMSYHPHVANHSDKYVKNTIYTSGDKLSILPSLKGSGVLKYDPKRVLTKDDLSISRWKLPKDVFGDVNISHHSDNSWKDGYFQSVAKGQEFVVEASKKVIDWAKNILP